MDAEAVFCLTNTLIVFSLVAWAYCSNKKEIVESKETESKIGNELSELRWRVDKLEDCQQPPTKVEP